MDLIEKLLAKARDNPKRLVFPEGEDEKIVRAAALAAKEGVVFPILLGAQGKVTACIESAALDIGAFSIVDSNSSPQLNEYVKVYCKFRYVPSGAAARILRHPVYFGAMMVRQGEADAMVAGIAHPTEDVIMATELVIGLREGISTPSSFFIMDIPGYSGPEGSLLVLADAALNPDPDSEQLADIAITTAKSTVELLGWEPRVAMLSFSTKGSACHPLVDKVVKAVELVRQRAPDLAVDGELQADAALIPEVAKRKLPSSSPVAGNANVLIFPNLDAANIASKLVQMMAGAKVYGPVLQGFTKPVMDLSRGASVEDIFGTIILAVVLRGNTQ